MATPQVPQLTHPLGAPAVGVVDPVLPARAEQAVPGAFTAAVVGGGASINGSNSGAGGNGANGIVIVISGG